MPDIPIPSFDQSDARMAMSEDINIYDCFDIAKKLDKGPGAYTYEILYNAAYTLNNGRNQGNSYKKFKTLLKDNNNIYYINELNLNDIFY